LWHRTQNIAGALGSVQANSPARRYRRHFPIARERSGIPHTADRREIALMIALSATIEKRYHPL
jgi:hypothetical protein